MAADLPPPGPESGSAFARAVKSKAARKLNAQLHGPGDIWFGLGMSGLVGWSVAIPALLGALLGVWIDRHHPGRHSWTLVLLVAGLFLGCANAWRWISQQKKMLDDETEAKGPSHD